MGVSASRPGPRHGDAPHAADAQARELSARRAGTVVWHDLECGSYTADLALWRELAADARGVLDVGSGTGRVTLDLARAGHNVSALDLDAELLDALGVRAAEMGVAELVETVCADARTFALERRDFSLCLAPMQTVQLLAGADGRLAFLRRGRAHLRPGGLLACAIVTDVEPFDCAAGDPAPSPETADTGGTRYVSRATRVQVEQNVVRIERERAMFEDPASSAPAHPAPGVPARPAWELNVVELDRVSVAGLEREGREAGLTPIRAWPIPATDEHTGSVAVMFRA
jgi:SAM-dependent methyltransferase